MILIILNRHGTVIYNNQVNYISRVFDAISNNPHITSLDLGYEFCVNFASTNRLSSRDVPCQIEKLLTLPNLEKLTLEILGYLSIGVYQV